MYTLRRNRMNTKKKTLEITGTPHLPITVGMPAFIDEADGLRKTSCDLIIERHGQTEVAFETRNTRYLLHLQQIGGRV